MVFLVERLRGGGFSYEGDEIIETLFLDQRNVAVFLTPAHDGQVKIPPFGPYVSQGFNERGKAFESEVAGGKDDSEVAGNRIGGWVKPVGINTIVDDVDLFGFHFVCLCHMVPDHVGYGDDAEAAVHSGSVFGDVLLHLLIDARSEKESFSPSFTGIVITLDLPFHPDFLNTAVTLEDVAVEDISEPENDVEREVPDQFSVTEGAREGSQPTVTR